MKKKTAKQPIGPLWLRWLLFTAGAFCMGLGIALAVLWMNFDSSFMVMAKWAQKYTTYIPLTALLFGLAVYVLGALIGKLWISGLIVAFIAEVLNLVDYFKNAINGTPLELADFGLASKLGDVAGVAGDLTPPVDFWIGAAGLLFCVLMLFLFRRLTDIGGRTRFLSFSVALALCIGVISTPGAEWIGKTFGIDIYARMPVGQNHRTHGLPLSLWRDLVLQKKAAPEDYSEETMEKALERIDELLIDSPTEKTIEPNVIMILSESFFDLNRLPGLEYGGDPLKNFHALEKESISGTFYSHYLGYGTGYIEMAMQYGITNKDFGASSNICFLQDEAYDYFDALPEQFTKNGDYKGAMFHGYNSSLYNRTVTYPRLGYSDVLFSQEIQDRNIDWKGSHYGGYYMKDTYLMEAMLEEMKSINDGGQKAFMYGITMENHQPFAADKFNYECQMSVYSDMLSPENLDIARVMVEGHIRADQGLGYLIDGLRNYPEPTVVVYYGDHRPNLFMTDGHTVYTKLGLCPSEDTTEWSLDQIQDIYSTNYLIWSNDAALMGDQAGTHQDSSATALGTDLLELIHQPVSRYWGLLELVGNTALTNTDLYFVDKSSQVYHSVEDDINLTEEDQELIHLRDLVIYDAFYGKQYITERMNQLPNT